MTKKIRPAYFAGQFYSADADDLQAEVSEYLNKADTALPANIKPKALLSPHAGYDFSGFVSAHSYKTLLNRQIDIVFLLGNSHAHLFEGIAVDDSDYWQTPLGEVPVDKKTVESVVSANERIFADASVHLGDHILEVQLPFLQVALPGDFKIVPIVFGNSNPGDYQILADILASNLGENNLIVASSDLSHYPEYTVANDIDRHTLKLVANRDVVSLENYFQEVMAQNIPNEETTMCGPDGVKTIMNLAKRFAWEGEILYYANSGDVPIGDKERVVGYGSVCFCQK